MTSGRNPDPEPARSGVPGPGPALSHSHSPAADSHQPTTTTSETTPLLQHIPPQPIPTTTTSSFTTPQRVTDPAEETTLLPAAPLSPARLWLTLSATYVGVFLGAVDSSIMATLSAPIASEFRSLSLLSWLATAYLIANATFQPLSGRLTDIFGRGPGLGFSNAMFELGNLLS
jgi:hypothetical protein